MSVLTLLKETITQLFNSSIQIYMTNNDIPNQTSPLYNVQPTSHTSEKRIFPSLPYTSENLKFINKVNFQFSDLTDSEYITLCNMLLKYKTCYATHKNDVGKISTPFRIRFKPNAQLFTTETNLMYFLKNSKNITLSNKLVLLLNTNPFMAQLI